MEEVRSGDRVRIDIPDETDPDHHLHGQHGTILEVFDDDAGRETGDQRDSSIYRIRLGDETIIDLRWRDIRPPLDDSA